MLIRKLVISFWLLVISLFLTPLTVFAQTTTIPSSVSPTSPLYTDLLVHNIFHTFSCLAVGQSVIGQPCLNYVKGVPMLSSVNLSGGALGATTSMIGMLFDNPPVRTADYLASVGTSLGIVKEAHAQVVGSGANVLSPIINLWQVSRNISYVIMIIIFVVIGMMIVFRQKINPQTVITAQAALPGLVIGLILITFSYFLASLISDTAFIGTNIVGYYFTAAQNKTNETDRLNLVEKISPYSVIGIFSKFLGVANQADISSALASVWTQIDDTGAQNWLRIIAGFIVAQQSSPVFSLAKLVPGIGEGIQAVLQLTAGTLASFNPVGTLGFGLSFVAFLVLLYSMFKLLLRLINSFLTIIFLTISAPFQFLWASLPGRQGLATDWILNMLGNILIFPVVLSVFYFVAFIQNQDIGPLKGKTTQINQPNPFIQTANALEPPTIVGETTFPLFGGLDSGFVRLLLAFGALAALPAIPDIVIKTVGKASQAGQLLGQEIGGGIGQGQKYQGQLQQGVGQLGQGASGLHSQGIWQQDAEGNWTKTYTGFAGARPGVTARARQLFGMKPIAPKSKLATK